MIYRHFYNLYREIEAEGWNRCPKYENLVREMFAKFCPPNWRAETYDIINKNQH